MGSDGFGSLSSRADLHSYAPGRAGIRKSERSSSIWPTAINPIRPRTAVLIDCSPWAASRDA